MLQEHPEPLKCHKNPTCVKRVREGGRTPGCLDPARSGTPWGMAPRGQGPARPRSRETRKQPRKAGPRKAGAPQDRVPQDRGPTRPGPRKAGRQSQSGQSTTNKKSKRVQRSSERSSADPCALAGSSARVSRTINSSLAPQGVTVAATTTGPNQTADLLLFFANTTKGTVSFTRRPLPLRGSSGGNAAPRPSLEQGTCGRSSRHRSSHKQPSMRPVAD